MSYYIGLAGRSKYSSHAPKHTVGSWPRALARSIES
jgi:hypothetical protein